MAVTDPWSTRGTETGRGLARSDDRCTAIAVVASVLAILSALVLALSHVFWQLRTVVDQILPSLPVDLIVLSLILVAGAVITLVPSSRATGLGVLLAVGGLLAFEWTDLSLNYYASTFSTGYYGIHLDNDEVAIALVCLALSVAFCTVSAIGVVRLARINARPGRTASPARIFFILAAASALVTVILLDFYPMQYAFRAFSPLGNVLDLLGIVAVVVPFIILAIAPGRGLPRSAPRWAGSGSSHSSLSRNSPGASSPIHCPI